MAYNYSLRINCEQSSVDSSGAESAKNDYILTLDYDNAVIWEDTLDPGATWYSVPLGTSYSEFYGMRLTSDNANLEVRLNGTTNEYTNVSDMIIIGRITAVSYRNNDADNLKEANVRIELYAQV